MMDCCKCIDFIIDEMYELDFEIGEFIQIDREHYTGEYIVIPKVYDQFLYTNGLVMDDDVTVTEIPYAETINPYGTTVSIAS